MARYTIELDELNDEERKHNGGFKMNSSLEQARADLQATLTGKQAATPLETEAEARAQLRKTQELLAQQSQPGAKNKKPK
jgi:hypothetical protein